MHLPLGRVAAAAPAVAQPTAVAAAERVLGALLLCCFRGFTAGAPATDACLQLLQHKLWHSLPAAFKSTVCPRCCRSPAVAQLAGCIKSFLSQISMAMLVEVHARDSLQKLCCVGLYLYLCPRVPKETSMALGMACGALHGCGSACSA